MAVGFPVKDDYATGDVLTAANMNDFAGTLNTVPDVIGGFAAGKNKIINGDFTINQRAFTSTTTTATYGFDRWFLETSDGTATYSAQTFTPGAAPVVGYEAKNFARIVTTGQTLANAFSRVSQFIEDVRTYAGQTVTISFWAKAASGTPSISIEVAQNFGQGGSPSTLVNIAGGKVTISTSWARYSVTVAIPSIAGKTIGTTANTSSLTPRLWVSGGSDFNARLSSLGIQSNTFDIWGVQVEAGDFATPFQTASGGSPQAELAMCQRYYQSVRTVVGTAAAWTPVPFTVTMRVDPTVAGGGAGFANDDPEPNVGNFYQTLRAYQTLTLSAEF
jgi:hypothetical protein